MLELQYEITIQDHLDAELAFLKHRSSQFWFRRVLLPGLPTILIPISFWLLFFADLDNAFPGTNAISLRFWGIYGLLVGVTFPIYMKPENLSRLGRKRLINEIKKNPSLVGNRALLVENDGLHLQREFDAVKILWKNIIKIHETDKLFMFYLTKPKSGRFILVKRAFENDQQLSDFRQVLQSFTQLAF